MDNPYQAPNSRIEVPDDMQSGLASRGSRFGAAFLDGIFVAVVLVPLEYATGYLPQVMEAARAHERLPLAQTATWALISIAIFLLINGYPLAKNGQTWGKKICSIRIAELGGAKPSIARLAIRYGVYFVRNIPVIGGFLSLVNICLIFRSDKRCGHDLVAGTQVVTA